MAPQIDRCREQILDRVVVLDPDDELIEDEAPKASVGGKREVLR